MNDRIYFPQVVRVEVIDEHGRAYVNYRATQVSISLQDGERTLKIFTQGTQDV